MRHWWSLCRSESEQVSQEYLSARLEEITGTAPKRIPVDYLGWSRGNSVVEILDNNQAMMPCVSLIRSPETPRDGLVAELVDVGRGTENDFALRASEINGNIVLVRHEYMFASDTIHRRRKYQWAMEQGAIGFLIACHLPEVGPVAGSSGATPEHGIPAAGISAETAKALTINSPTKVRLKIEATESLNQTDNLILDLPGIGPEWIVLSAHIDGHHLAESAIDNATGLASVLAIASAIAPIAGKLTRGLRIALFSIEEWALAGSKVYVDGLNETEKTNIKLNINLDSIAGSPNLTALTSEFPKLEKWLLGCVQSRGYTLGFYHPLMANSDHFNFARQGIPAARLVAGFNETESAIKYVLTSNDTRDKISANDLKYATDLTTAIVFEACQATELELR